MLLPLVVAGTVGAGEGAGSGVAGVVEPFVGATSPLVDTATGPDVPFTKAFCFLPNVPRASRVALALAAAATLCAAVRGAGSFLGLTWKSARTLRSISTMYPATSGNTAMITMVTAIGTNNG